jgi:hypothetical protein
MPGRYAKNELSSGFLGSIDTYAYRAPLPVPGAVPAGADAATPPAPAAATTDLTTIPAGEVVANANAP